MSIFSVRPRSFAPAPETDQFAPVAPELDSWKAWDDEADQAHAIALAELAAWRSLLVTSRDQVLDVTEGAEPGLADALARLAEDAHRVELDAELADGESLAETVAGMGDSVTSQDIRVNCVLRPLADGSIEVARFAAVESLARKAVAR